MHASTDPVVFCMRMYTTTVCLPHAPRPRKEGASVRWRGLGLSWKVSWNIDRPVLQEIRVCLLHRPVGYCLFTEAHDREKTEMYDPCRRQARIGLDCWPVWAPQWLPLKPFIIRTHTCSYFSRRRGVRQISSGGVHKLRNTTGSVLAFVAQEEGTHVPPQVLDCLGSSIASMKPIDNATVPRKDIFRHDPCKSHERRWFQCVNTPPVVCQECVRYTTDGVLALSIDNHLLKVFVFSRTTTASFSNFYVRT